MFDKFGKFNSVEELNMSAEGLKAEGDKESFKELAEENGIDIEDAADYWNGDADCFATSLMAINGRIDVETKALALGDILEDWANYIKALGREDETMAAGIMKGSLSECIAKLLMYSYKNMKPVPADIVKAAGISGGNVKLGIPGAAQAKKIIRDYYMSR